MAEKGSDKCKNETKKNIKVRKLIFSQKNKIRCWARSDTGRKKSGCPVKENIRQEEWCISKNKLDKKKIGLNKLKL